MNKMVLGSAEYDAAVERKQKEIRGNVSSVKMTPAETEQAIKEITGGAISSFAESDVVDRTVNEVQPVPPYVNSIMNKQQSAIIPRKRGRPKGSRNRPKSGS